MIQRMRVISSSHVHVDDTCRRGRHTPRPHDLRTMLRTHTTEIAWGWGECRDLKGPVRIQEHRTEQR